MATKFLTGYSITTCTSSITDLLLELVELLEMKAPLISPSVGAIGQ